MMIKTFQNKKIKIRKLSKNDLKRVREFCDFINSLVKEDAQIKMDKKFSLKEEIKWLKEELKKIKNGKEVFLVAEENNKIVGTTGIHLSGGRQKHVGIFGISIRASYRGMGLGSYLTKEIIKLAKKELKPRPKIIRLSVLPTNEPAIRLYQKFGFKKVAQIPKQIYYKGKLIDEIIMLKEI